MYNAYFLNIKHKCVSKTEFNWFKEYFLLSILVHRIGRTGRSGRTGIATTFINKANDESVLLDLKHLLIEANQKVPPFLAELQSENEKYLELGGNFCFQLCFYDFKIIMIYWTSKFIVNSLSKEKHIISQKDNPFWNVILLIHWFHFFSVSVLSTLWACLRKLSNSFKAVNQQIIRIQSLKKQCIICWAFTQCET